jgi:WD40 repeat protein
MLVKTETNGGDHSNKLLWIGSAFFLAAVVALLLFVFIAIRSRGFVVGTVSYVVGQFAGRSGLNTDLVEGLVIILTIPFFVAIADYAKNGIVWIHGLGPSLRLYRSKSGIVIVVYVGVFFLARAAVSVHNYSSEWCAETPEGIRASDQPGLDPIYGIPRTRCSFDQIVALRRREKVIVVPHKLRIVDPRLFEFFDSVTGKPLVWYSKLPDGQYEFFDGPGKSPETSESLVPIDGRMRNEFVRIFEEQERKERENPQTRPAQSPIQPENQAAQFVLNPAPVEASAGAAPSFSLERTLEGHGGSVYSAPFSPDGRYVGSASRDHTAMIWDVSSGRVVRTLAGHSDMIFFSAFSPNGRYLATASRDHTAKVWDLASGLEVLTLEGHSNWVHSVAFGPDGRYIATGSDDNSIKIWDSTSGVGVFTLSGHSRSVMSVAFSPDGKYLASGSLDSSIKIWEVSTGRAVRTMTGHSSGVVCVIFSPDGKYVASASADRTARVWEVDTGRLMRSLRTDSQVNSVSFSPDGRYLAGGCFDGTVRLWDLATARELSALKGHIHRVFGVAFSPDGRLLSSAGEDESIRLWRRQ